MARVAALRSIDEINANGGAMGKKLEGVAAIRAQATTRAECSGIWFFRQDTGAAEAEGLLEHPGEGTRAC